MKKFTRKQIVLIVLMVICTVLFIGATWFLMNNLINSWLVNINENPEIRGIVLEAIYLDIAFQTTFALFYGLFLWLAIATIKRESKDNFIHRSLI